MGQRLDVTSELKPLGVGAAKASPNRAMAPETEREFVASDPKPGDLAMGRLKVG